MKNSIFCFLVILLSGCASSHVNKISLNQVQKSTVGKYDILTIEDETTKDIPDSFIKETRSSLEERLRQFDLLAEETMPASRQLKITFTGYRMRSDTTRSLVGIFAGMDKVQSTVVITDASSGEIIGESTVSASNGTAIKGSDYLARKHAYEVVSILIER